MISGSVKTYVYNICNVLQIVVNLLYEFRKSYFDLWPKLSCVLGAFQRHETTWHHHCLSFESNLLPLMSHCPRYVVKCCSYGLWPLEILQSPNSPVLSLFDWPSELIGVVKYKWLKEWPLHDIKCSLNTCHAPQWGIWQNRVLVWVIKSEVCHHWSEHFCWKPSLPLSLHCLQCTPLHCVWRPFRLIQLLSSLQWCLVMFQMIQFMPQISMTEIHMSP